MSNAIENNSPKANNYDDQKSNIHATTQDETTSSQPSAASSPFNSFIVEYEIGSMDLQPRSPKEPNVRLKKLTMSGEIDNRDQAFLLKSQELPKYDDHMVNLSSRLPQVSENMNNINGKMDLMLHQAPKVVKPGTLEEPKKEASTRVEVRLSAEASSTPRYSGGSKSGVPAFSFPILDNADMRNSLGNLISADINNQMSYLETSTVPAPNNEVVKKFPVAVASATPTANGKNWFCFACFQG